MYFSAKEYGEKIIQDVIASWWIILLYADDTVMLLYAVTKLCIFSVPMVCF